jgi:poly-gamma-glutamate synthesis protein (capsule biosynthesis protein)
MELGFWRRRRAVAASLASALLLAAEVVACGAGPAGSATSPALAPAAASPVATVAPTAPATPPAGPAATAATAATPSAPPVSLVPVVPIVPFWSTQRSISRSDVALLLGGSGGSAATVRPAHARVAVSDADAAAIETALGIVLSPTVQRLAPDAIRAAVRGSANTIGFVRAEDVTPDVRALAVDGVSLFGSGRLQDPAAWPLDVTSAIPSAFDPAATWVLAAGGDVNLERGIYKYAVQMKLGPDYPWQGGYARIKSHKCCGFGQYLLAVGGRTGSPGALGNLLRNADLVVVNLEGPAPNDFVYHGDGLTFSFDPALLAGLANAGIDGVSMANNHLLNAGPQGVLDTCANLDKAGIKHAGAGANLTAARQPVWFSAGHKLIALLAYDQLQAGNFATASRPGAAPYKDSAVVADIRAAKADGADFVIVMPHWGSEYSEYVGPWQRADAAAFAAAGADVILGSHSHFTGPIEAVTGPSGAPVFVAYSLGDLLFDLNYSESTQEGVIADLTYAGTRLVQVDLHPTLVVDHSQVNLLNPATDGRVVLDRIHLASARTLRW